MKIETFDGDYRWLSNFYPCQIAFEGLHFPSVENAYQAAKTDNIRDREPFIFMTAAQAKKAGRKLKLRDDWEQMKVGVMRNLLVKKFQIPKLRKLLVETGDAELIEGNYWGDVFWGVYKGWGENQLGHLLMSVRLPLIGIPLDAVQESCDVCQGCWHMQRVILTGKKFICVSCWIHWNFKRHLLSIPI